VGMLGTPRALRREEYAYTYKPRPCETVRTASRAQGPRRESTVAGRRTEPMNAR
jgi:hypothetical protein